MKCKIPYDKRIDCPRLRDDFIFQLEKSGINSLLSISQLSEHISHSVTWTIHQISNVKCITYLSYEKVLIRKSFFVQFLFLVIIPDQFSLIISLNISIRFLLRSPKIHLTHNFPIILSLLLYDSYFLQVIILHTCIAYYQILTSFIQPLIFISFPR